MRAVVHRNPQVIHNDGGRAGISWSTGIRYSFPEAAAREEVGDMLSDSEVRVLAVHCFDHAVARCDDCQRDYKITELGVEVLGRRYYFCAVCRLDFVDDLRLHILGCPVIAKALHERIERSRQLMKQSDGLVLSSAVLAAESLALCQRVFDTKRGKRHVPPPSVA